MAVERVTCPLPVRKILVGSCVCVGGRGVGVGENIQGILMVKTVSGAWLKDTEKFPPSQKILSRGLVGKKKPPGNYSPSGKVLWAEVKV